MDLRMVVVVGGKYPTPCKKIFVPLMLFLERLEGQPLKR